MAEGVRSLGGRGLLRELKPGCRRKAQRRERPSREALARIKAYRLCPAPSPRLQTRREGKRCNRRGADCGSRGRVVGRGTSAVRIW